MPKTRGFDTFDPQNWKNIFPQAELIFNTVPAPIPTDPLLIKQIRKDAVLLNWLPAPAVFLRKPAVRPDFAGSPVRASGRFSPKASARILCRAVLQVLGEGR